MFNEDEGGNRMVIFMTGLLLGATAALLMAPQSGRRSREQLWDYGQKVRDKVNENIEGISGRAGDMLNRAGETFNRAVDKGRDFVQGDGLGKAVEKGREFAEEGISKATEKGRDYVQGEIRRTRG